MSSRSPASRSLVRENSGSRALGPRDPAAASAAGAWGAEDGEARSALTGLGNQSSGELFPSREQWSGGA